MERPAFAETHNCGRCGHFFENSCRRNPPGDDSVWPSVYPENWCGEFIHKLKLEFACYEEVRSMRVLELMQDRVRAELKNRNTFTDDEIREEIAKAEKVLAAEHEREKGLRDLGGFQ